jgi:hypothetical protein
MGFISGALVQFLPRLGGVYFVLCDENIPQYSALSRDTKEKGGSLMQVYAAPNGLQLCISGAKLNPVGFAFGDYLIARYQYGLIRIRKMPPGKIVTPHVSGKWLAESGFVPGSVFTIDAQNGLISCQIQDNSPERTLARNAELVKYARANKLHLHQVNKIEYYTRKGTPGSFPFFDIPPHCLKMAGFSPDAHLFAGVDYGLIQLQAIDFDALGF